MELSAEAPITASNGQMGRLKRDELTSHSQLCEGVFILPRAASVRFPSFMNPEPRPGGYSFCFLVSTLARYYIIRWHVNQTIFGMRLRLCGDDTEGARSQEEVSLVL